MDPCTLLVMWGSPLIHKIVVNTMANKAQSLLPTWCCTSMCFSSTELVCTLRMAMASFNGVCKLTVVHLYSTWWWTYIWNTHPMVLCNVDICMKSCVPDWYVRHPESVTGSWRPFCMGTAVLTSCSMSEHAWLSTNCHWKADTYLWATKPSLYLRLLPNTCQVHLGIDQ